MRLHKISRGAQLGFRERRLVWQEMSEEDLPGSGCETSINQEMNGGEWPEAGAFATESNAKLMKVLGKLGNDHEQIVNREELIRRLIGQMVRGAFERKAA